jgi:glutamate---cysteine ligase / carboxylate-amine ligase
LTLSNHDQPPSADALRARFDAAPEFQVGLEEEVMLLDPGTLELAPRASEILARLDGDERFKLELPASQLEILTAPQATVPDAIAALGAARRTLAEHAEGAVRLAGAGVSPLGSGVGVLNDLPRYRRTLREYGWMARRQLVCAFQVHVSVKGAERALAIYNSARAYLPWLAALAANGAFYLGRDTELASVRPKLSELLPRQGIPPALGSWEEYADALRWGADTGTFPDPGTWWWELRLHSRVGTLEFRVPDAQSTVGDAAAIAGVIHALVAWLAECHSAGERLAVTPTWQIDENRWSACRDGVEGAMIDPRTGERRATRACLDELLETLAPSAARLGAAPALERARAMVRVNGAIGQREAGRQGGAAAVASWLTERFLLPWPG